MPYDISAFRNCLPSLHECITVDPETEEALHAARWPTSAFDTLADFLQFTYRFSCVIQPYIFDPQRDELDGWFHADPASDDRAAETTAKHETVNEEANDWMRRFYPTVSIDWLRSGLHGKIISFNDGDWPEMVGHDTEGYFTVFVADAT
jgi:hypothetical protein